MNKKILSLLLIPLFISLFACQEKKEPEGKKEVKEGGQGGYVLNFKSNDTYKLVPSKTIIFREATTVNQDNCFLDVVAKEFDHISEISFILISDPAYVKYKKYKAGTLFEETGKPVYDISLEGEKEGEVKIKISFESDGGAVSGSGKIVSLCFDPLKEGQIDFRLERGEILDQEKSKVAGVTYVGGILYIAR